MCAIFSSIEAATSIFRLRDKPEKKLWLYEKVLYSCAHTFQTIPSETFFRASPALMQNHISVLLECLRTF